MNKNKIFKIIRWCSISPFIILFLYAIIMAIGGNTFLGEPISSLETFLLVLILGITEYWWIFLISILISIGTTIVLSTKNNLKILKIIRILAFIPYILILYILIQNLFLGDGITKEIKNVIDWITDPEGKYVFLITIIIIIITTYFINKKKS